MTPRPTISNRELLATCWTSAGDAAPDRGDEVSPVDLRTRIETAAEVGWEGLGLLHADLAIAERTIGLPELRRIFDSAGIKHVELEVLPWWWTTDERRQISDPRRTLLFDAAEVLGARTIKVAAEGGGQPVDPARFLDDFDRLATQAGNAGTRVALEIISEDHRQLPIREGLTRARTATLQALGAAEGLVASAG